MVRPRSEWSGRTVVGLVVDTVLAMLAAMFVTFNSQVVVGRLEIGLVSVLITFSIFAVVLLATFSWLRRRRRRRSARADGSAG